MPNDWIEHVRAFAKKNNLSYGCAITNPNVKDGYVKKSKPVTVKKSKEQEESRATAPVVKAPAKTKKQVAEEKAKAKKEADKSREWIFKPTKNAYGSNDVVRRFMLNALSDSKKIVREGLFKDKNTEDFNVGEFKEAINTTKKPQTAEIFKIAKYLQREDFGKIVFSKAPAVSAPAVSSPIAKAPKPIKKKLVVIQSPARNLLSDVDQSRLNRAKQQLSRMDNFASMGIMMDEDQREEIEGTIKSLTFV
tara:strand:- start:547 stop:1293 length:747 start_codon:yes stop_codon:yes gene_type:complete